MRKFRRVMYLRLARLIRGEKNIVPCIISSGTKITGNITDGDVIHIDGKLEGDITCNELVLGATGSISGNVRARTIEIYGELTGTIKAENLFISSTAKFVGDSVYKTIAIEPGAVLVGKCCQNEPESSNVTPISAAQ